MTMRCPLSSFTTLRGNPRRSRGSRPAAVQSRCACTPRHLFDAVHAQAGLDAVDIDDQYAGAVGLFGPLHAEAGAHVDDRQDDAAQIGDAVHVGWRAGDFRHLGKANDFLYRHDVEAKLFVFQQERDELAFVLQPADAVECLFA
jgi:hypothetical protein